MKDFTPKGTGDSRYLKSAIPANTTWEDMRTLLRNGTFPFDFNGINPDGVVEQGTALNKANLLSDDAATDLWFESTEDPTPTEAFQNIYRVGDIKTTTRKTLGDKWLLCNGQVVLSDEISELKEVYENDTIFIKPTTRGGDFNSGNTEEYNGKKWTLFSIEKFDTYYVALYERQYMYNYGEENIMLFKSDNLKSTDILNDWEYIGSFGVGTIYRSITGFFKFNGKYVLTTENNENSYINNILVSNEANDISDVVSFTSVTMFRRTNATDEFLCFSHYVYNNSVYFLVKNPGYSSAYLVKTEDLASFAEPKSIDTMFSSYYNPYPIFYNKYVITYSYDGEGSLRFYYADIEAEEIGYKYTYLDDILGSYMNHIKSSFTHGGYIYLCGFDDTSRGIIKVSLDSIVNHSSNKLTLNVDYWVIETPENLAIRGIFLTNGKKYALLGNKAAYHIYQWTDNGNFKYLGYLKSTFIPGGYQFFSSSERGELVYAYAFNSSDDPYLNYILFYGEFSILPNITATDVGVNTFIKYKK